LAAAGKCSPAVKNKLLVALALIFVPAILAGEAAADIRAVLQAQTEAWNRGDLDGFMAAYEHSDSLRFASGGTVTHGWQATLEHYKKRYPDKAMMGTLNFTLLETHVLAPDDAVVFGKWELVRAKDHPSGLFTLILHRIDGSWRITADHTSSAEK
jgi:uncharacterized protein (TIGR02246 family)